METMADRHNQLRRFFSVLLIVLFKGVTSYTDNNDLDANRFGVHNELSRSFPDKFSELHDAPFPVENRHWHSPKNLGEVSGVAVSPTGVVMIFHRGDRTWDYDTFNENAEYQEKYKGPIRDNTILELDPNTGNIMRGWGNQTFYLPHGIYVDNSENVWLTDIALHQVFKYSAFGDAQLVLGQKFEPGNDMEHFCQPTSVVVLPNGEIVVADGYCNSRIVLFDKRGKPKYSIGEEWISLRVPHSLTILSNEQVCVADRENSRIVCLDVTLSGLSRHFEPPYSIRHQQFGRIFGIASYRNFIYAVNGVTSRNTEVMGFIIDPLNRNVTGFWGPGSSPFVRPHAIAVCPFGTALYVSEIGPNKVWSFNLI
ncbi:peptidyl-alpha-hydroxyglycine alpha-amidating lyase 2 [Linepithema humile]|uniref:peptidyl-alpha-hydroxyglycine alpha-amidating lyase 2 n=1 Tax=Linepithema humile TaxID=83485 RepID=UPI0006236BFF|nr:PREDICTED: peptidyl-alpha-hydroxyglycine alpha-amidating lyase 2 [Linepithema humile]XP_012235236.1 PREDICTED: peptidyl-alpha-hydroxyglycine alpha-amidating lyase 2 [Linepithema humile]